MKLLKLILLLLFLSGCATTGYDVPANTGGVIFLMPLGNSGNMFLVY